MKERPILFSAPMVRAILDGSKTQTRRVCKPAATLSNVVACQDPATYAEGQRPPYITPGWFGDENGDVQFFCPYGQPGDRLWVRETFLHVTKMENECFVVDDDGNYVKETWYRADRKAYSYHPDGDEESTENIPWKPSIHMPRWASRITLEVTEVRVERLQDISDYDARDEGAEQIGDCEGAYVAGFRRLWESINGSGSWDANPWVWVIGFRRLP